MKIKMALEGRYRIEAFKTDIEGFEVPGTRKVVADWFPNLILDAGLDRIGSNADYLMECRVGSGATPPAVGDTALQSLVASTATSVSDTNGAQATAPYYGWFRKTYRFGTGVAAGNLSEVGVGWIGGANPLFSRALILDPGGTPTTISVAADESLDVTYEIRTFVPVADASGTVDLGGVTYDWVSRASQATTAGRWAMGGVGRIVNLVSAALYNGVMGPVTGQPSGTVSIVTATRLGYTPGSYAIGFTINAGLTQGNISGGIKSIRLDSGGNAGLSAYQVEFDPAIPKDGTKIFSLTIQVSWARKT